MSLEYYEALQENSITSIDHKYQNICFSIDSGQTKTNFIYDPYFKFYPEASSPTKSRTVYRIYFKNPPGWTVHKSPWIAPTTMDKDVKDKLIGGLLSPTILKYRDPRTNKMVSVSTTVWNALTILCSAMYYYDGLDISGIPMPDYTKITYLKSRTAENDEEKEEKNKNDKSSNKSRTSRSRK